MREMSLKFKLKNASIKVPTCFKYYKTLSIKRNDNSNRCIRKCFRKLSDVIELKYN